MSQYRFSFLSFILLEILSQQAFSQAFIANDATNHSSGMSSIAFTNLNKIRNGSGLRVFWVRYDYLPSADGATTDDKILWLGSYDAYIVTNTSIENNLKNQQTKENSEVLGKKDNKYWSTMEPGIVDIDSISTGWHKGRVYYVTEELTNVLTMGFGVHWNINSIKVSSGGKVYGKSKDLTDNLEGIIDYFQDGRMKDCFYRVPKLDNNFLLSYSYGDAQTNNGTKPNGANLSSISLSLAVPSENGGFVKTMDYLKYDILDISEIKPEEAKTVGVPPPELYRYALISNQVTIPQGEPLTPKMIGATEAKITNDAPMFSVRQIIIAAIIIMNVILAAVFFKRFRK